MSTDSNNGINGNNVPPELNRGFGFRVAMTVVFFILAVVYILWLIKML